MQFGKLGAGYHKPERSWLIDLRATAMTYAEWGTKIDFVRRMLMPSHRHTVGLTRLRARFIIRARICGKTKDRNGQYVTEYFQREQKYSKTGCTGAANHTKSLKSRSGLYWL